MGSEDTICENERGSAHSWDTNALSFQVFNRVNVRFHTRLNAQTSAVDPGQESYIQTLFDGLKEVHYQVMSDVVAAERQCVFISRPVALHQFGLESLLLEETLLVSGIDRSFASQTNVTDADLV